MLAASWDLPTLTNRTLFLQAVHIAVSILDAAQPDPDVYITMLETLATCPTPFWPSCESLVILVNSESLFKFAGLLQVHWMLVLVACYHQRARVAEGRQMHKEAVDEVSNKLTRTPQMLSRCCQFDFSLKILMWNILVRWLSWFMQFNIRTIGYWGFDWVLHSMLDTCCNILPLVCPHSLLWAQWKHGVSVLPSTLRFQRCSLTLGIIPWTHPMPSDFF